MEYLHVVIYSSTSCLNGLFDWFELFSESDSALETRIGYWKHPFLSREGLKSPHVVFKIVGEHNMMSHCHTIYMYYSYVEGAFENLWPETAHTCSLRQTIQYKTTTILVSHRAPSYNNAWPYRRMWIQVIDLRKLPLHD